VPAKRAAIGVAPPPVSVRGWLVIAGGAATAAIVLVAWLPVGALLHQRAELSSTTHQLNVLSSEGNQLAARAAALLVPGAKDQFARADYQLVKPGQVLIQVLTPSFTPSSRSSEAPYPGDPGRAPLVSPSEAGLMPVAPVTSTRAARSTGHRGASPGFFSRVVTALEFWR
jgi:cell division protein FtsB